MAASSILSPPPQFVIGEDMVAGQQERYNAAEKSSSRSDQGDDQSTINTAASTGSLSSSDDTASSLMSSGSSSAGSTNAAMGLDLTDDGNSENDRYHHHLLHHHHHQGAGGFEASGLMSAAAAAAEAARSVRQQQQLQPPDSMTTILSAGELCDPYAMSTPVTTPGALSSCASPSPAAAASLRRSRSFNGMDGEPHDAQEQFGGYQQYLEHMRAAAARLARNNSASEAQLHGNTGFYSSPDGGSVTSSGAGSPTEELSERMVAMNLHSQQQQHYHHQQQSGHYAGGGTMLPVGMMTMGSAQRMGQRPRSSPMMSPNSDTSELTTSGLHESVDGQSRMSDLGSPSSSSSFSLPPPAAPASSPTTSLPPRQQHGMPSNYMQGQGRLGSEQHHMHGSREHHRGNMREGEEEGHMGRSSSESALGLSMGNSGQHHFMGNNSGHSTNHPHHQHSYHQGAAVPAAADATLNHFNSNPYNHNQYNIPPAPQEGIRPRSLSEGSFFYGPSDDGLGSNGVYPPGLGPRFQGYTHKTTLAAGIPPAQAQQMVQWITHFVRQKGGVITAANLGSALARLHPEFYTLIKASHGGLTAFLADYPERFSFANDPPFNHVFLSRELGSHTSPSLSSQQSPSPPGLSLHHPSAYGLGGGHGPPPRLVKPMGGSSSSGLPMSAMPLRSRSMSDPRLSPQPLSTLVGGMPAQMGLIQQQGQHFVYAPPGAFKVSASPTGTGAHAAAFSQSPPGGALQGGLGGNGGSGLSSLAAAATGVAGMAPSWPLDQHLEAEVVRATSEILCNAASYALKAVELANTLRARLGTKVLAKVREKYGGLLFMLERHPHLFRVDRIPKNDCVTLLPKGLLLVTHPGTQVPAPSPSSSYSSSHSQQQQPGGSVNMSLLGGGGGGGSGSGPSTPVVSAYAHTIQQLQQQVAMAREKEAQAKQVAASIHRHGFGGMQQQQQQHHHGAHCTNSVCHCQSDDPRNSHHHHHHMGSNLHHRRMGVGISPLVTHAADHKARLPTHLQSAPAAHHHHHQYNQGPPPGPPSLQASLSGGLALVGPPPESTALQRRHSWSNLISPGGVMDDRDSIDQAIGPPQGQRSISTTSCYGAPAPPSFHRQHSSSSSTPEPQLSLGLYGGLGFTVDGSMETPGPGAGLSPECDEAVGPATSHNNHSTSQQQSSHGQIEKQSSTSIGSVAGTQPSLESLSLSPQLQPEQLLDSGNNSGSDADDKDDDDDDDDDDAGSGGSLSPGSEGVGGELNNVGSAGSDPMPPQMSMWGGKGDNGEGPLTGLALRGWDVDGGVDDLLQQSGSSKTRPMEIGIPGLMTVSSTGGDSSSSSSSTGGATRSQSSSSLSSLYGASPPAPAPRQHGLGLGLGLGGVSMCPVLQILTNNHFVPTQAWPAEPLRDSTYVNLIVEELRNVGGTTTVSKLRGLLKHKLGSKETIKSVPLKALLQAYRTVFTLHRNHVTLNGNLRL